MPESEVGLEELVRVRTLEVARQRRATAGVREVLGLLNANRPMSEILDLILLQAELLFGANALAVVFAIDLAEPVLDPKRLIYWRGVDDTPLTQETLLVQLSGALHQAVQQGAPVTSLDVDGVGGERANVGAHWVVPVHFERNSTGAVAYLLRTPMQMTEETAELAAVLSDQVVLAVTSTRLQRRAQEAAKLEERERLAHELHDAVTQSIYSLTLFAEAGRRLASLGQIDRVQEYLTLLGDTAQQAMKQMRLDAL